MSTDKSLSTGLRSYPDTSQDGRKRRSIGWLAIWGILLLVSAAAGGVYLAIQASMVTAVDPEVARVAEMAPRPFDPKFEEMTPEERQAAFTKMREEVEKFTDDQRRQFFELGRKSMMKQMEDRVMMYASLPKESKQNFLDEEIDRMEAMRAQFQGMAGRPGQPPGGFPPGGPGPGGPGGGGPGASGPGSPNGGPGGPGGGRPPWMGGGDRRDQSSEGRANRMRDRLNNTTPEFRAAMSEFRTDMEQRREERGLPAFPGPPGGGRGPW